MEMEDHQSHHHTQYGIDLRQFISGRPTHFSSPTAAAIPHPTPQAAAAELFSVGHTRNLQSPPQGHHHYDMMMLMPRATTGVGFHEFRSESCTAAGDACVGPAAPSAAAASGGVVVMSSSAAGAGASAAAAAAAPTPLGGLDAEGVAGSFRGDGGTGRWPRQETLTLLEIRSRLDSKFKEANQKGPLWDEVSRIMAEEHGYQRSGKKCREKFENLYKYYKKTKEGKAGRQDGKHYRFFRQLEALYGDTSNSNSVPEPHFVGTSLRFHNVAHISTQANQEAFPSHQKACDSLSLSNSLDFETSSSEDNDPSTATLADNDSTEKRRKRRGGKGWKTKIKEFIDSQMRKLIDKQEAWLEKLTKTLEQKEQERLFREEEWRKQEAARIDREHKFWAKERAWIEARDSALMEALHKLTGREANASSPVELMGVHEIQNQSEIQNENGSETINNSVKSDHSWPESEITRLIQLRTSMNSRFQQSECREEILWEEIAAKMVYLGYERSASMCKDKWDSINHHLSRAKDCNKKRKENSRSGCYFPCNESVYTPGGPYSCELNDHHQQGAAETLRLQANDGSSPANSNAGNAVSDSCFRFLMTEGETLWENYGLKLSKGDHQSHN